ncbi:DUF1311 domain-containing protein [Thermomonas brevis]|uniref:DUF1311 domain-containing protein n=1 Tax=Thermomonas brevis TaxID=215691 RepID=A0A7G9QV02_9GAMM|nr:lysozyme inhibitor LprI family protein [Thermomonas brevis]QNN47177.1 DUF1311 domain-containing protein [Thermomonas brevis]
MRLALGLLLVFLAAPISAADQWPYETECRKWADVAIPQQDIGTAPTDCDTRSLYYGEDGHGRGRDDAAARRCAYRARAAGDADAFDGSGALMMLYANGRGVARNIPLAKRFACEYEGAPAEVESRLEHLDAIASGKDKASLDICDDITSGMMGGVCARRNADFARVIRSERRDALQASWTPAQRAALAALLKAADAYFESASYNEEDMSGTAHGAFAVEAYERLDIALLRDVERFETGIRPDEKAADFPAADKALNAAYRRTLAALDAGKGDGAFGEYGTIRSEGVRETERLWLRYRDAWVAFAATRYPDTAADIWRAWLSRVRAKALSEIARS